jgi:hypothetical protein
MKLNLSRDLAEKVLSLTREYSYAPEEVISIGIALTSVLLKERALGIRLSSSPPMVIRWQSSPKLHLRRSIRSLKNM